MLHTVYSFLTPLKFRADPTSLQSVLSKLGDECASFEYLNLEFLCIILKLVYRRAFFTINNFHIHCSHYYCEPGKFFPLKIFFWGGFSSIFTSWLYRFIVEQISSTPEFCFLELELRKNSSELICRVVNAFCLIPLSYGEKLLVNINQALPQASDNGLGSIAHAQLAKKIAGIISHGAFRKKEFPRDIRVGQSAGH